MSRSEAANGTRAASVPGSRVTIAQVASRAGVSPTTVSHVLSGKRVVGSATRTTVMEAIRELGPVRGSILAAWRVLRCNPFSHGGVDELKDRRLFRGTPTRSARRARPALPAPAGPKRPI